MVYFSEDVILTYVGKAPSSFTQLARNPANSAFFGENRTIGSTALNRGVVFGQKCG